MATLRPEPPGTVDGVTNDGCIDAGPVDAGTPSAPHRRLLAAGGAAATSTLAVAMLMAQRPEPRLAQLVGDLAILLAVLAATAGCARAARRGGPSARGWTLMTVAVGLWATGHLAWTYFGISRDHQYPFSLDRRHRLHRVQRAGGRRSAAVPALVGASRCQRARRP